jgi:hypothetical protein
MCPADCGPAGQYIGSRPPPKKNTLAPAGPPTARYGVDAARMCPADCGPAGQYIGSRPPPKKTHWPRRGRRPRINKPLHQCGLPICRPAGALTTLARRCFATNMSPLWGFNDAGAAILCYQYVAPLGLFRHVCAERIVAQRANILVASPRSRKYIGPVGAADRAKTNHYTNAGYRYVAPLGL